MRVSACFDVRVCPGCWKPCDYDYYQLRKANMLCLEHICLDAAVQVNGLVCILDCRGWGLQHLIAFPISQVRKTIDLLQVRKTRKQNANAVLSSYSALVYK